MFLCNAHVYLSGNDTDYDNQPVYLSPQIYLFAFVFDLDDISDAFPRIFTVNNELLSIWSQTVLAMMVDQLNLQLFQLKGCLPVKRSFEKDKRQAEESDLEEELTRVELPSHVIVLQLQFLLLLEAITVGNLKNIKSQDQLVNMVNSIFANNLVIVHDNSTYIGR